LFHGLLSLSECRILKSWNFYQLFTTDYLAWKTMSGAQYCWVNDWINECKKDRSLDSSLRLWYVLHISSSCLCVLQPQALSTLSCHWDYILILPYYPNSSPWQSLVFGILEVTQRPQETLCFQGSVILSNIT
jgi:hypothetical protein